MLTVDQYGTLIIGDTDTKVLFYVRFHHWVVAELHVDTPGSLIQTGLSHLHWVLLVLNGLAQQLNVLLHVEDLLHSLLKKYRTI